MTGRVGGFGSRPTGTHTIHTHRNGNHYDQVPALLSSRGRSGHRHLRHRHRDQHGQPGRRGHHHRPVPSGRCHPDLLRRGHAHSGPHGLGGGHLLRRQRLTASLCPQVHPQPVDRGPTIWATYPQVVHRVIHRATRVEHTQTCNL